MVLKLPGDAVTLLEEWASENLIVGVPEAAVVQALVGRGVPLDEALNTVNAIVRSPTFLVAREINYRYEKQASLLDVLCRLSRPDYDTSGEVELIHTPGRDAFVRNYLRANRPVVLDNALAEWPALKKWSPSYFATEYGEVAISASLGRESDPEYEHRANKNQTSVSLANFVQRVRDGSGNDAYVVAGSGMLNNPSLRSLRDDIGPIGDLLDEGAPDPPHTSLWFGGAGTITSLHHDDRSGLLCQVYGTKEVLLVPPWHSKDVYNERYCFSALDLWAPNVAEYPAVQALRVAKVHLRPGQALHIPVGWWHAVKSLTVSISVSLHNLPVDSRWRQAYYGDDHPWQKRWRPVPSLLPFPARPPFS